MSSSKPEIKREFVFATYAKSKKDKNADLLVVKEILHHPDNTKERRVRCIYNYQRPFYCTKKEYRTHKDKRECESLDILDKHLCTHAELPVKAYMALNGYHPGKYISATAVAESPYLYGSTITTPVLVAQEYAVRYPNLISDTSLAIMDYEWDVIHGHGLIVSGVLSFKDKLHIAITKDFLKGINGDLPTLVKKCLRKYLGETLDARGIVEPIISVVDSPAKVVLALFKSAHKWSPDVLGFWNIKGDINKVLEVLKLEDIDPAFVFSDPSVPKEFQFFRWHEDALRKEKANGSSTTKGPVDLWHTVTAPASFYCICLMATFKLVRDREQSRGNYKLDSVLKEYINVGKLKTDLALGDLSDLEWHRVMQRNHPLEYSSAYMAFDGIGVEMLDEKTNDISKSLRAMSGISELSKMKSNPSKLADDMHFSYLSKGNVICSVSSDMTEILDEELPSIKGWIVTLPAELEDNIGCNLINEYTAAKTNITTHAFDVDVLGSYPHCEIVGNIGKSTRILEVCGIKGIKDSEEVRRFGINLSSVTANALSLATMAYGYPLLPAVLTEFKKERNLI